MTMEDGENGGRASESEARKREATVIRRTIEPFLRDDPGWETKSERVAAAEVREASGSIRT